MLPCGPLLKRNPTQNYNIVANIFQYYVTVCIIFLQNTPRNIFSALMSQHFVAKSIHFLIGEFREPPNDVTSLAPESLAVKKARLQMS